MIGLSIALSSELKTIFSVKPVFAVLILGAAVYAVFYPQPYLNETLREVPVALVDRDGTQTSRDFARLIAATSDVAIAETLPDLAAAERAVYARSVSGIVLVPANFERDLLHGRPSPVALYADASYFLIYQRISGAVASVARTLGAAVETSRLISAGIDPQIVDAATDPLRFTAVPLFNPQGGYATYLLPAAFVLILQQLLLMGVGLANAPETGTAFDVRYRSGERVGATAMVVGKLIAYLFIEAAIVPAYLVGLPYVYGIPRLGSVGNILILAVPFVLSVAALGLLVALVVRRPLAIQLMLAAIGMPFMFMAGFAWPAEAIPEPLRTLSVLVPSTTAIDGLVRVSQMGETLSGARDAIATLWILVGVYAVSAVAMLCYRRRRSWTPITQKARVTSQPEALAAAREKVE